MKKIILFLILLCPIVVKAEVNYKITDYLIRSDIEIAGGIKVKELIVLDGNFNGYERDIVYKNESLDNWEAGKVNFAKSSIYNCAGIDKLQVATFKVKDKDKIDFDMFNDISKYATKVDSAVNGDTDVYTVEETTNGQNVRMYKKSNDEKMAFYLEYVITNAIVIHEDVAELYYPYVGDQFSDPIDNVQVQVFLPFSDNSKNFRIWAHGPLNGTVNKYQDEDKNTIGLIATTKNLPANTGFDIRLTFDKELIQIPTFLNHSEQEALPKILKVEQKRADDANNKRKTIKTIYYSIYGISIAYLIGLALLWLYIYLKHDKEYKSDFKSKYYREFIDDYNVEVIDYLLHKSITSNALSAAIMNLIYKKNIKVEEIKNKKKKDYKFILNNQDNLNESEEYLIDFLFNTIGKNNEFTTKDLKSYASSSHYSVFTTKYTNWKNKVIAEAEEQEFYENKNKIKSLGIMYFVLGIIILFINLVTGANIWLAYLLIIPALVFVIYTMAFNKRTKKGNEHYRKWQAFKNFLNDFGTFDIKELPEIALWERYMVYAVIFGLAKKVQAAMNVKIKEFDINDPYYHPYLNSWLYYDLNYSLVSAINDSVASSINAANAQSMSSSGSGFGGGFSSGGGGSFGGGGGGHGF